MGLFLALLSLDRVGSPLLPPVLFLVFYRICTVARDLGLTSGAKQIVVPG